MTAEQQTQIRRIFTATLIIGISGAGKTSLSSTLAEYLWETYQRVLLLYSCDGGAFPTVVQKRVQQGLIRVWRMRTRSAQGLAFESCYLASKGYWPQRINPTTGETDPAVAMVAPISTQYALSCPQGHLMKTVPLASLIKPTICPVCKGQMLQPAQMGIAETVTQTKGFEAVGGAYYDGLSSMSSWFMGELDERSGRGELGGEKSALGGTIISGDLKFGGNSRAHYGFAQTRIQQIVNNSLSIPNLVEGPVFTALSHEVEEGGQLPVVGPKLAGSAKTDEAPQWFGNVFEARQVPDEKDRLVRRLYLTEFIDKENRRHLLKNSSSGSLPENLTDPYKGEGAMFSQFNLGLVFRLLDADLRDSLKDSPEGMPGIAAGMVEYGEAKVVTEAPSPATPSVDRAAPTTASPALASPGSTQPAASAPATAPKPVGLPRPLPRPVGVAPAQPVAVQQASPELEGGGGGKTVGPPPPPGMKPPMRAPGS